MPPMDKASVLIDTCVWIEFLNRPRSRMHQVVDALLDAERVLLIGPVLAEILLGCRRSAQADWVASVLRASCDYIEPAVDDWCRSAQLGRHLASQNHKLPLTDLILATVAMRHDADVYTTDPHFDLIPELKRYQLDS